MTRVCGPVSTTSGPTSTAGSATSPRPGTASRARCGGSTPSPPREQCSVHLSRGMLAFELSRPQQALESFAEAARLAHALGVVEQEFMARHNEGYAAFLLGDIPRSLAGMAAAELLGADVVPRAGAPRPRASAARGGSRRARPPTPCRPVSPTCRTRATTRSGRSSTSSWPGPNGSPVTSTALPRLPPPPSRPIAGSGRRPGSPRRPSSLLLVDLDRQQRTIRRRADAGDVDNARDVGGGRTPTARAAAALADELVEVAGELGDSELADGARVVAAQALLLAGDAAGREHPTAQPRAGLIGLALRRAGRRRGDGEDPRRDR